MNKTLLCPEEVLRRKEGKYHICRIYMHYILDMTVFMEQFYYPRISVKLS